MPPPSIAYTDVTETLRTDFSPPATWTRVGGSDLNAETTYAQSDIPGTAASPIHFPLLQTQRASNNTSEVMPCVLARSSPSNSRYSWTAESCTHFWTWTNSGVRGVVATGGPARRRPLCGPFRRPAPRVRIVLKRTTRGRYPGRSSVMTTNAVPAVDTTAQSAEPDAVPKDDATTSDSGNGYSRIDAGRRYPTQDARLAVGAAPPEQQPKQSVADAEKVARALGFPYFSRRMHRKATHVLQMLLHPAYMARGSRRAGACAPALTCCFVVGLTGFEPATP